MKCKKCVTGTHKYYNNYFCCKCFDTLVDQSFHEIVRGIDELKAKYEGIIKSEQEISNNLIEDFTALLKDFTKNKPKKQIN